MTNKISNIKPNLPPKNKNFRVLIIDDEIELLEMVCEQVKSLGYDVISSSEVEKSLDLIPYCNGILADVNMPGKQRLNEILATAAIKLPVIRFSAERQTGLVNFMLSKPFTLVQLKGALEQLELFAGLHSDKAA
jgi:CheY-like chemotaxis protein